LSACTPDASTPTTLAPLSPTPTPSPATTLPEPLTAPAPIAHAAPVLSTEAKEQTAAGAKAFVRHYFAVVDYAYATGDTDPLMVVSDPECLPCRKIAEQVLAAFASDQKYVTDSTVISAIGDPLADELSAVEIDATYSSSGWSLVNERGDTAAIAAPVADQTLRFVLVWSERSWLVRDYGVR